MQSHGKDWLEQDLLLQAASTKQAPACRIPGTGGAQVAAIYTVAQSQDMTEGRQQQQQPVKASALQHNGGQGFNPWP